MALSGVLRPGHVAIRVMEMEPALKHYVDVLGLKEMGGYPDFCVRGIA